VAGYRHGMTAPVLAQFHLPATGTLVDAMSRAADLPVQAASQLRGYADQAYTSAFVLISLVAAAMVAVAALLATVVLRTAAPEPVVPERAVVAARS
jgi:hypothetical protein